MRKAASKRKKERFTALFHHISVEHLEAEGVQKPRLAARCSAFGVRLGIVP
jgi:hypothetical protein